MTAWAQLRPDEHTKRVDLDHLLPAGQERTAEPVPGATTRLGEHPTWSTPLNALVWVDIDAGRVLATDVRGATRELFVLPGSIGAALPGDGPELILLSTQGVLGAVPGSDMHRQIGAGPRQGLRFNDAGLDPAGRVWAGVLPIVDPTQEAEPTGALLRLDAAGEWHEEFGAMGCPNGIVWTADGRTILVCESDSRRIAAADYDVATGLASNWRVAWEFVGEVDAVPDGLELAPDGRLSIAFWGLGAVVRFDPDGTAEATIRTQDVRTTSMCTAPDGTVWVTTAGGLNRVR